LQDHSLKILPGDIIAASAIIIGFGLTVIMFRIQRELLVRENPDKYPGWPSWLAWSDYLILFSALLGFGAVVLVLAFSLLALASAFCAAAVILQSAYFPAILAHYRIEIGKNRTGKRQKGEPAEKWIVRLATVIALIISILVWQHAQP
jgi:hypothetical protein